MKLLENITRSLEQTNNSQSLLNTSSESPLLIDNDNFNQLKFNFLEENGKQIYFLLLLVISFYCIQISKRFKTPYAHFAILLVPVTVLSIIGSVLNNLSII